MEIAPIRSILISGIYSGGICFTNKQSAASLQPNVGFDNFKPTPLVLLPEADPITLQLPISQTHKTPSNPAKNSFNLMEESPSKEHYWENGYGDFVG